MYEYGVGVVFTTHPLTLTSTCTLHKQTTIENFDTPNCVYILASYLLTYWMVSVKNKSKRDVISREGHFFDTWLRFKMRHVGNDNYDERRGSFWSREGTQGVCCTRFIHKDNEKTRKQIWSQKNRAKQVRNLLIMRWIQCKMNAHEMNNKMSNTVNKTSKCMNTNRTQIMEE